MQLGLFAAPAGSSGRTSPEHSQRTAVATLESWLARWLGPTLPFQSADGERAALQSARTDSSNGACWTRSMSEFNHIPPRSRSDVAVSSLSSILERGPIDPRYFLSPKACSGILRRAEKRGKELPGALLNFYRLHTNATFG